jgi:hypothetical protein
MTLRLKGSTSGHTEVKAPASAGSNTITLPTSNGSAEQFLKNSGTAGELEFSSMVETSTGVGIGTAAPSQKLHVENTSGVAGLLIEGSNLAQIILSDNNGGTNDKNVVLRNSQQNLLFGTQDDSFSSFSESLRLDKSGNLGIGTAPDTILHINPAADCYVTLQPGTTDGNAGLLFDNSASAQKGYILYDTDDNVLTLGTNNSERMRINSSGNVGIGTSSFTASSSGRQILEINGTSSALINLDVGGTRKAYHSTDGTDVYSYNTANGNYIFGTNDTERLRIDSAGKVKAKGGYLYVQNSASGTGDADGIALISDGNADKYLWNYENTSLRFGTNNSERMRIDSSGNVLVAVSNTTKTSEGFRIENGGQPNITRGTDGTFISFYHTSGSVIGSIQNNGGTGTLFNTSSDYRLKENVVDIADGITRVKQLSPKRFNFIADDTKIVDGFIAHEAQTVVPEAVTGTHDEVDADGNAVMQGIDQSKLVPLLTAALQEAIAKIETLETEVAALKAG